MTPLLRVELILFALIVVGVIVRNVNRKRLRIQYSLLWLLIALALMVSAFFPGILIWLCGVLDIETPANLVYLLGILVLLLITFYQTLLISHQAEQIKRLTQEISLEKFRREERGDRERKMEDAAASDRK